MKFYHTTRHHIPEDNILFIVYLAELTLLSACFMLITCITFSSILKVEAALSSETSVNFYLATRHYIPTL
jgi:hypothetical protein